MERTHAVLELFAQWDRFTDHKTDRCLHCTNAPGHAGGDLNDPNECGFCNTPQKEG